MGDNGTLRVLFVNENLGGHGSMHLYLKRALASHSCVTAEFFDLPSPGIARRLAAAPIPGLGRLDADFQPLRFELAQSLQVRRVLDARSGCYDLLHVYTHNAALASIGALRRGPSVVSLDATGVQNSLNMPHRRPTRWTSTRLPVSRFFESRVYDAATLVVAQSEWAAASLRDYGVSGERIRVVPFGVTVPETSPSTPPSTPPSAPPQITFTAARIGRKGGRQLMDVYRRHLRSRCELNLVTRDAVLPEPGIRVLSDVHPGDNQLVELLRRTSVFVLPTEGDASPFAVLEAMALGVPVVTTRVGALPEIVEDGVTGILVDVGDDDALATAIGTLLDDDDARSRMGAAGRRRVLDRYAAERTTAMLLGVFSEAMERFQPS
jgi:hypothetical protein